MLLGLHRGGKGESGKKIGMVSHSNGCYGWASSGTGEPSIWLAPARRMYFRGVYVIALCKSTFTYLLTIPAAIFDGLSHLAAIVHGK